MNYSINYTKFLIILAKVEKDQPSEFTDNIRG